MKTEQSRYLFVAGIVTGMVMSLVSVMMIFNSIDLIGSSNRYWEVIALSMMVALLVGILFSIFIRRFIR